MSRSTPPTPSTPSVSSSSIATTLVPFSTTSTSRLQALYSDFSRQKQSNPASYHANVEWWHKALESLLASGMQEHNFQYPHTDTLIPPKNDRLVLHIGRSLVERVKIPKVGKPLALGSVISELRHTKSAVPLTDFMSANASIYDPGWLPGRIAAYVVGKPLWWTLEHLGIVGDEGLLSSFSSSASGRSTQAQGAGWHGDFVFVALLERAADQVEELQAQRAASKADALFTIDTFRETFASVAGGDDLLREADARVLIKYLERDRAAIVVDGEVIKFVDQSASAEDHVINAVDRGILELKAAIRNLHAQVESLQKKMEDCTKKATLALQQKRKPVALGYLKSRKLLDDVLQKRLGSLSTLESTFIAVETAAGDIEILKSYESSTATLRTILSHPSLERSRVDKTMDALAEANQNAKEVDEMIRVGGDIALGIDVADEDELEAELKAMVEEILCDDVADKLAKVDEAEQKPMSPAIAGDRKVAVPS